MRTVVDIDDEALAAAAAELGTTTKKDTINTALRLIAGRRERAARVAAATHVFGDPKGLDDPAVQRELTDGRGRRRSR
ncbi:MAG TPA: type II toxin-antitoxin system VapB family antitoxin [Natronosporangium sp.]